MGLYNHHKSLDDAQSQPIVFCSDMCGEILETGPGVSSWTKGDRVMPIFNQTHLTGQIREHHMANGLGLPLEGCLQDYRVFPEQGLVKVPDYLSDEEASCLPIAAVTAWMSINTGRPIGQPGGKGDVILVQGTGGVSISGLQIAKAIGATSQSGVPRSKMFDIMLTSPTAIVTSSSDDKLSRAKELGADHIINYRSDSNWERTVMKITNGNGADNIFEVGGARTLRKSFDCVTFGGVINSIGYVTGKQDDPSDSLTNINVLALRRTVTLRGIINGPRDRFEEMVDFYSRHQIRPAVDRTFDFDQAKEALQFLYDGSHFGKVIIKVA